MGRERAGMQGTLLDSPALAHVRLDEPHVSLLEITEQTADGPSFCISIQVVPVQYTVVPRSKEDI